MQQVFPVKNTICPTCGGTGWKHIVKNDKEFVVRCNCYFENRKRHFMQEARIPRRYIHCSIENFADLNDSQNMAKVAVLKFVEEYPALDTGLLFMGPCGVGKTHLAVGIIKKLITEKSVPCLFYDFRELMKEIKRTYNRNEPYFEGQLLEPVLSRPVVILDELGGEKATSWSLDTLMYIINTRYNRNKLTIFTSNFFDKPAKGEESLTDRIGYRLRSRLYEMCKLIYIEGEDFRKHVRSAGYQCFINRYIKGISI